MNDVGSIGILRASARRERRERLRRLAACVLIAGTAVLGYTAFDEYAARSYGRSQLELLDRLSRAAESPPAGTAGLSAASIAGDAADARARAAVPLPSGLVGRIDIERLGISAAIMEGTDTDTLRAGVGHVPGSAFPGAPGNVALAGHRDSFFSGLRDIRPGDHIDLRTPYDSYRYEVVSTEVVEPHDTWVLEPAPGRDLTLITCYPFSYIGPAPKRLIVHAVSTPTTATGTPSGS